MWEFKREENSFDIPDGEHRLRIKSAEKKLSKKNNDMIEFQFEVSGYASILYHYIVFLPDYPEITNRSLTSFFDSFGIEDGNFNLATYKGKVGGGKIKHDEEDRAKIHYFINKKKQEGLAPWKEGLQDFSAIPSDDGDLPF